MRLVRLALVGALLLGLGQPSASGTAAISFGASRPRYVEGRTVTIRLVNNSSRAIRMGEIWTMSRAATGEAVAEYHWTAAQTRLRSGESRTWSWSQRAGCAGACDNPWEGDLVGPGRYRATTTVDGTQRVAAFDIGAYFTLGFRSRPRISFVVFSRDAQAIGEMRAEAQAEEKTKIVSGIVRLGRRGYNPDWSFHLGPGSIVLGEVFTEVCDASPYYVQRHRRAWAGKRWCPWSSYVAREGR